MNSQRISMIQATGTKITKKLTLTTFQVFKREEFGIFDFYSGDSLCTNSVVTYCIAFDDRNKEFDNENIITLVEIKYFIFTIF